MSKYFEETVEEKVILSSSPVKFYANHWLPWLPYDTNREEMLVSIKKLPKEYYINEEKETVVLRWYDDTITKVKLCKEDKFDAQKGFLIAYFQKHSGLSKTKANEYLKEVYLEKNIEK